jgi:SWI/SNF-related matrix-associated actin-dependent regulator 1 of chromatin subfamily A
MLLFINIYLFINNHKLLIFIYFFLIFDNNYTRTKNKNDLINLDDIRGHSAISLLEAYEGINPYIKKLKIAYLKNNKLALTENQSKYITENSEREPLYVNRVIGITTYLGEELKKIDDLSFTPEKVLIEFILAETDKTFHVYGKLKQNQKESKMYWLPKTQVTDDPYFEQINIDVDFSKYNDILSHDGKKLYQHQEDGVKFLLSRKGCILADDMGLGKSIQSIIGALESGAKKILVVCPSSTKINWEREINVFCDDTTIIDGKKWSDAKFTIINFDILKNFHTLPSGKKRKEGEPEEILNRELANAGYDLCIIDEAHYLKNNESIRGKIMVELCVKHKIERVWLLTGTPVANRPMDFFNLLKIIKSPIAENWKHYALRYCDGRKFFRTLKNGQRKQIWLTDGASNLEELANKTKNTIIRRLKTEVLDMPDKVITPMHHMLDRKGLKQYELLWEEYLEKRKLEGKKTNDLQKDLVELILLRQFIALEAIPYTIEMAENAIEMGRKVIVFTSFTEELEVITNHFGKIAVKHNGPMTTIQKQKSVDAFQNNDKIKIFVGNIKSAGVGITLTEATVVIFNSFDWVPGNNEQAEDRAFRIGQKNDVNVYYQLFDDTISSRMWSMLNSKKDIINIIMGDKKLTEDEITALLVDDLIKM